jgi:putative ubiquitin-RnfH superfamily antitoxin RatB of RatAB toxin-antitoxin module
MSTSLINVEVAYATPTKQAIVDIAIKDGSTVEEAIIASNIVEQFPEIDLSATKVGIWSRVVKLRDTLIRKRRAEKAKEEGRADKVSGGKLKPLKAKN